ncbi:MAG: hypothetical protein NWR72_16075 [Bacteroidia bacterium]|nr:hypothetical protein [Bacteroidia bacterium]
MKFFFLTIPILLLSACVTPESQKGNQTEGAVPAEVIPYPTAFQQVLDSHGGIDTWRSKQSLQFDLVKESGTETHQINLWTREDKVTAPDFAMGYDGSQVWLMADTSYQGNAVFYHNLIFYFYAMPFVLADEGIVYSETAPLVVEGKTYPGIKMSFESGVGTSDKDEYLLHYDPETYQMAWLGYTVTYFTGEKATAFNWIRYDDWATVDGLVLPNSMSWYDTADGLPTEFRNKLPVSNVRLSGEAMPETTFAMPAGAEMVE